jgi:hypothetical protein
MKFDIAKLLFSRHPRWVRRRKMRRLMFSAVAGAVLVAAVAFLMTQVSGRSRLSRAGSQGPSPAGLLELGK